MSAADSQRLLQHIRRLAGDPAGAPSDAELLRRYLERREQAAFSALIRRHGPMVFAACRSVLRQEQDAEDAFQATFLILAQKGSSIHRQEGLGGWLQRVAYRVALRARANRLRRRSCEEQTARSPEAEPSCEDISWRELRAILHAELAALPEKFRAPLVLCYLEGLTQEEAAFRLGWTAATVKGRLQRGREKLRRRLERRGVALTAALGAALTGQVLAESAVPALRPFTVETATTAATALAHGFGPALASMKWKILAILVFSAGLAAGGVGMLLPKQPEQEPTTASAGKSAAEKVEPRTDLYGDPLPEGAIVRMGSLRFRHPGLYHFGFRDEGKTVVSSAGDETFRFWDSGTGRQIRAVRLKKGAKPVQHQVLSPGAKTAAAFDNNGGIALWSVDSGELIKTLPSPKGDVAGLYFSADGKILIANFWQPSIVLFDWNKGKERRITPPARKIGHDSTFHSCISPDGTWLAVGGGAGEPLYVYETETGREAHRFLCNASTSIFSPDSKRLIVSSMYNDKKASETVIRIFDLADGKQIKQYPIGNEYSFLTLDVSADGKMLACSFSDRSCVLDLTTGRIVYRLSDRPILVGFTPDNKTLIGSSGMRLRVWDALTGQERHNDPGEFGHYLAAAVSPDGRLLAEADWLDQAVSLWDTTSGRLLRRLPLKGEKRYVRNLAFSPDGKILSACQYKGFLQFGDAASGKEQRTVQLHDPGWRNPEWVFFFQLRVSPDGAYVSTLERLIGQTEATRLAYWQTATGKLLAQHLLPAEMRICAWSADGTRVILGLPDGLTCMDVRTGAIRYRLGGIGKWEPPADRSRPRPVVLQQVLPVLSPDDRLLAVAVPPDSGAKKEGSYIGVWENATAKQIAKISLANVSHLAVAADNRHLLATDAYFLRVFDLATGAESHRWRLPVETTGRGEMVACTCLLLLPDGRRAVTALNDGTALVWDLQPAVHRGKPLADRPSDKELAAWWTDLADDDARRAYAAIWRLTEFSEAAILFLRQHLKPATDAETKTIRQHIADLDGDEFAMREKALKQLAKLGLVAEPVLRQALERKPTLEMRRRIEHLLEKIDRQPPAGESLRLLRALQVLENTGREGRRLLRELASGAEGAWLTRAAQAMLARQNQFAP